MSIGRRGRAKYVWRKSFNYSPLLWVVNPGGPLGNIGVHMRDQKNAWKGVFSQRKRGTRVPRLGGLKHRFSRKRGVFLQARWTRKGGFFVTRRSVLRKGRPTPGLIIAINNSISVTVRDRVWTTRAHLLQRSRSAVYNTGNLHEKHTTYMIKRLSLLNRVR